MKTFLGRNSLLTVLFLCAFHSALLSVQISDVRAGEVEAGEGNEVSEDDSSESVPAAGGQVLSAPTGVAPGLPRASRASQASVATSSHFKVPVGLEGKVEFWKLIFGKYGKDQYVFHHREYPEIIYSVLDLAPLRNPAIGTKLPKTGDLVDEELERIRSTLKFLGEGGNPRDPFERRLRRLFAKLEQRSGRGVYLAAAEEGKIRYQQGIREKTEEAVRRSGRYLHGMEKVFADRGLPLELTRLPFVESSFDYTAYSSVGAAGIWQFMRSTGKKYLRINSSIDERRDPIAATYAAADYLKNAYDRLGNWPLAVSSYNHGVGGILRGVDDVGSRNLVDLIDRYVSPSFGFASKNFYAEFLAAVQIEREAERYFPGIQREEPWYYEEVLIGKSLSILEVSRYAECSKEDIERLNRSLLQPVLTGRVRIPADMVLRLPPGAGKRLQAKLKGSAVVGIFEPPRPKPEPAPKRSKGKKAKQVKQKTSTAKNSSASKTSTKATPAKRTKTSKKAR